MINGKKIAIYTASMGGFDKIEELDVLTEGVDYIYFTDNLNLKSDTWKIITVENEFGNSRKKARQIKLNPHLFLKEYDYSIWIDGNVDITQNLNSLIEEYFFKKKTKIATFQHFSRNCLYAEALACAVTKKDNYESIYKQVKECVDNNFPTNYGLAETNVMLRQHNDEKVQQCMEEWWRCVQYNSIRDQLSFDYVLYKHAMTYEILEGNARDKASIFKCREHGNNSLLRKSISNFILYLYRLIKPILIKE